MVLCLRDLSPVLLCHRDVHAEAEDAPGARASADDHAGQEERVDTLSGCLGFVVVSLKMRFFLSERMIVRILDKFKELLTVSWVLNRDVVSAVGM